MVTTYTTNTLLEFIAITPGGGGGGGTGTGTGTWATQTADTMGIFIAVLLAIAIFAFIALRARQKMMAYAGNESSSLSRRFTKAYLCIGIFTALLFVIGGISLTYTQVVANPASNDGVSSPEKIQAHVDETTGATTFDVSYLKNGIADPATVLGLEVTLAEGVDDGGSTWTVQGFGGKTLYENVAGQEASAFSYDLAAGATENITVATSDMTADVAKSLIGKGVLNLKFTYAITPAPITYKISFTVNDPAGGSISPSAAFTVNSGASYKYSDSDNSLTFTDGTSSKKIEVKAASGYKFTKWTINDNPVEIGTSTIITESSVFKAFFDEPREVIVNGVAKDADGLPMVNAAVDIYDEESNPVTTGITDSNGNYSLAIPETFLDINQAIIKVRSGNNISQDIVIEKPGQQTSPIAVDETAVVEASVNISGVLLDDKGQPVEGAKVVLTSIYTDNNGNVITETFSGITGEDGEYSIKVKTNKEYVCTFDKNGSPEIHASAPKKIPVKDHDIEIPSRPISGTTSTVVVDLGEGTATSVPDGWAKKGTNSYYKDYNNETYINAIVYTWISAGLIPPKDKVLTDYDTDGSRAVLEKDTTITFVFDSFVKLEGFAKDINGSSVPEANARFVTDDGEEYSTTTDMDGFFNFDRIPINTPGTIQISKENLISPAYKIGAGGGFFDIPTLYLEEKVNLSGQIKDSDSQPMKNTEIVITTYTKRTGIIKEENYYTKTNDNGKYDIYVQQDHKYSISVAIPGTTPPVYLTQEHEVAEEAKEINLGVPKATETALVTIDLNGGSVNKGASGWTKVKAGTYTRTFALGSNYEAITSEWSSVNIKPPSEGKELTGWEPLSGTLSEAITFKANWGEEAEDTPKAVYTEEDQTFTFYYDNIDHSQDFANEGDQQFNLIEDTRVDFGDLSHCVYAPWQNRDSIYDVIPDPKVQPQHVVFDSSFAAFNAYPDSKNNETKPFTSMSGWFMNMPYIQDVSGFEYIYDGITDFSLTFCIFKFNNDEEVLLNNSPNGEALLDLTSFKQNNLTNVMGTFSNSLFSKIILPGGFAPNATSFGKTYEIQGLGETYMGLFSGCNASKIEILGLIGTGVKDFSALYLDCHALKTFDDASINMIDFSQAEIIDYMFESSSFSSITIPETLKISQNITSMKRTFKSLNTSQIDLSGLITSKVTNMQRMLSGCPYLVSIDLSTLDFSSVEDMSSMFNSCIALKSLDMSKMNLSSVTDMSAMFRDCISLETLNMSELNLANVTNTSNMFCSNNLQSRLISVEFPNDPSKTFQKLENASSMFYGCVKLETIKSINWNFDDGSISECMFTNDTSLIGGNDTHFDPKHEDGTYARVDTVDTPGYFTDNSKKAVLVTDSLIRQDENAASMEEQTPDVLADSEENLVFDDTVEEDEVIIEPIEVIDGNIIETFQMPFDALFNLFRLFLQSY